MSAAAAHAHCNTTIGSAQLLDEEKETMAHLKVVEHWDDGKSTPIPPDAQKSELTVRRGGVRPILTSRVRRQLPTNQGTPL